MYTLNDVNAAWARFEKIKEEAEQYMFPKLLYWDMKLTPLYKDLCRNWDDHHAEIFMKGMNIMFYDIGVMSYEEFKDFARKSVK